MSVNRRTFLLAGSSAAAARAVPASDQIVLGLVGSGGRGTFVMGVFQKNPGLRVGAVCDVYEPNLERALSNAAKAQNGAPKAYRNYKQLLDDKDITAVLIATPEHWHHRMVLDALAAGKDVYVEKPLCQTPEQGVELVEAEKKTRQIIQVGMQRRSYDLYLDRPQDRRGGQTRQRPHGALLVAQQLPRRRPQRQTGRPARLGAVAGTRDAPRRRPDPDRFRAWRYYSDYAGGIVADQGAHVFDGIHLLMNASYPLAVNASANRAHRAGSDRPESVVAIAEYPEDFIGIFTVNYAAMKYKSRFDQLNQLDGDKARMDIGREECNVFAQGEEEKPAITLKSAKGFGWATDLHVQNFLECCRTRRTPTAPMRLGFQAALVVQLVNRSLALGRRVRWNDAEKRVEV